LEVGAGRFRIATILSGSMLIPESETMCPRSFPLVTPKIDLEGFKEMSKFPASHENLSKMTEMI
jgi:hypothetical protein